MTPIPPEPAGEPHGEIWPRLEIRLEMARRFLDAGLADDAKAEILVMAQLVADRRPGAPPREMHSVSGIPDTEIRPGDVAERELACPLCAKLVKVRVDGSLRAHSCTAEANAAPPLPRRVPPPPRRLRQMPDYSEDALTREQVMGARG